VITSYHYRMCDVHRLLDYDTTDRLCGYCSLCDAFICKECEPRWDRRIRAAIKRKLEPGYKGILNYEEIAGGQNNESSTNPRTDA